MKKLFVIIALSIFIFSCQKEVPASRSATVQVLSIDLIQVNKDGIQTVIGTAHP